MESVLEVDADNWEKKVLQSDILTTVEFWHEQCPWCIKLEPIYNEVAGEYREKIRFTKLNVLKNEENRHLAIHYGVMSTPTIIFFCEGRKVDETVGFMPKGRLKKRIEEVLKNHRECLTQSTKLKE